MSQQNVQISFCLPVYNVKEYIRECIRSIYEQNLSSFEIICVDDGSSDGSCEELEKIAKIHPEMTVLHNESNRGIGYTRNKAIKHSTGKYIWFVDADDMLVPDTAGLYYDVAEKTQADAVLGRAVSFSESMAVPPTVVGSDDYKIVDFSDPDHFYSTGSRGYVCFGVWAGIFRRKFLTENDLFFYEDIRALEEFMFYVEFGIKASRVISIDHYGYYYRLRADSVSHEKASLKNVPEAAKTVLCILEDLCRTHSAYAYSILVNMAKIERYAEICLIRLSDTGYVRQTLKLFQKQGFYPHRTDLPAYMLKPQGHGRIIRAVIYRALRIKPFFWTMHYAYKLCRFLKQRMHKA